MMDGTVRLRKHANSKEHKDASMIVASTTHGTPIDEILKIEKTLERDRNRKCLLKVIGSLRFFAIITVHT